ncbi:MULTISPECIES: nitrogen fixation protein NifZ [unclassified Bradyrhizobium]|uniref:nitrogen fixation protein NifZ n=1 Tax=unclassified Bradyrhizobium TaxID=2631580 RepID=UPI00093D253B|nr:MULTISPECIES: nitrogen fixation protein NifZ [unclassified Bradyrhizobium]OKO86314.1 NifZ family protein [Bradyrhizobium sp. AS23.2]OKO88828.1 NifZ family protein [Bradyrhizobium sp. NAS80.1]
MTEARVPKYRSGQCVRIAVDLVNDGSVATAPPDGILVGAGRIGQIVRVMMHTETSVPIYLVKFRGGLVVGCLEEEITVH